MQLSQDTDNANQRKSSICLGPFLIYLDLGIEKVKSSPSKLLPLSQNLFDTLQLSHNPFRYPHERCPRLAGDLTNPTIRPDRLRLTDVVHHANDEVILLR